MAEVLLDDLVEAVAQWAVGRGAFGDATVEAWLLGCVLGAE